MVPLSRPALLCGPELDRISTASSPFRKPHPPSGASKRILAYTIDGELLERLRCFVWTAVGGFLEQRHPPNGWVGKRENARPIAQPVLTPLVATASIRAPDVLETGRCLACRGSSWVAVQFPTRARASCRVSSRLPRERVRICRRSGMFLRRYTSSCALIPAHWVCRAMRGSVRC